MTALEDAISSIGLDPATLQVFSDAGDETVYYLLTSGEAALDQWRQLRELVETSGYWPVILGDDAARENLLWSFDTTTHMPRIIAAVDTVESQAPYSAAAVVDQVLQYSEVEPAAEEEVEFDELDEADELDEPDEADESDEFDEDVPRGDWPEDVELQDGVSATINLSTGEYLPEVCLGFVPAKISWQVPAFLRFSNPDFDLNPIDHCVTLQSWEQLYGAEVVALTGAGTIEMLVAKPPQDKESAIALALEQFSYCSDIVTQGTETIDALAAELLNNPFWYFWWD